MKASVLIVDDDPTLRKLLVDRFRFWGHTVDEAGSGDEALAVAPAGTFDLVLLDLMLPDISGLDVLKKLRSTGCEADIIVLTAHGSIESAVHSIQLGANDFLQKPADFTLLEAAVTRSLERRRLSRANQALTDRSGVADDTVLGRSAGMATLLETARRAAEARSTVLLTGETGTGKQLLAEFIHRWSPRRDDPFVYVNCVALPNELLESTLFGHEKGAFTGAVAKKTGRLEMANGGTIFLDEIGDMPLASQAKLLHFLESGDFERLGGNRSIKVDTRTIAATNRDLKTAVREGHFREDLYFRLNVIALAIPPLRERPDDIQDLALAFAKRFASELGRTPLPFLPKTLQVLRGYSWPGNVRQLRNAIERMVVLAGGDSLGPELLPLEILGGDGEDDENLDLPLDEALRRFEKHYLRRTLARLGGNQTKAAQILGRSRTYLNQRLRELGLRDSGDDPEDGTSA